MSIDYDGAARELARLQHDVMTVAAERHVEQLVRLTSLARVLIDTEGPIGHATTAVANEYGVDHVALDRIAVQRALAELMPKVRGLVAEFHRHRKVVAESAEVPLRRQVQWRGQLSTVGNVLAEIRDELALSDLSVDDALSLREVLPRFCECLDAQIRGDGQAPAAPELPSAFTALRERTGNILQLAYERIHEAEFALQYTNVSDHHVTLAELRRLVAVDVAVRTGSDPAMLATLAELSNKRDALVLRCERLVSAVRARLLSSREQAYVFTRLKTWLARFKAKELVQRMCNESTRAENILQATVDEFLYQSGLYPLTHFVAGAGRLDTFAELLADDQANRETSRSILVELKQAVTSAKRSDVQLAIREVHAQAREYSAHARSNPRWVDHEVFCLVVYAGEERFHVDARSQVHLVYVGSTPPSAGSTLLESPNE